MKKSRVYRRKGKRFRYDYGNALVQWVIKATKSEYEDNKEWQEKYKSNLWDIDDNGYIEVQSVGLMKSNWTNKANRDSYLDQWIYEIEEECAYLAKEYERFG